MRLRGHPLLSLTMPGVVISIALALGLATGGCGDSTPADSDAATGADSSAGGDGGPCLPSCAGRQCGDDGCGGQCPSVCTAQETCDTDTGQCVCAGEVCDNVGCGPSDLCHAQTGGCCAPESDAALGGRLGADCGLLPGVDVCGQEQAVDNCGLPRTVHCGDCVLPAL